MAGRKTKYKPEFVKQARKLAELGHTDKEMADFFEVVPATFYTWRLQHDEFAKALTVGKDAADDRVERALYHRAVGYEHEAVKVFQFQGEAVTVPYIERVQPDVQAAQYWLNNRRGWDWKSKVEHEHSGTLSLDMLKEASERAAG